MHSVNLIVVEDEPAILSGIAAQIKRMDLPISITGIYLNGAEALKDLSNSKPDLIITDVQMPVMTGLELISRLKEQQYPAVPILLQNLHIPDYESANPLMTILQFYALLSSPESMIRLIN